MLQNRLAYLSTNYGKIELHLKEILDMHGITRYRLAKDIDTGFTVIDKWYQGKVEKLDLDILARICYVLDCEVSELLEYCADAEKQR